MRKISFFAALSSILIAAGPQPMPEALFNAQPNAIAVHNRVLAKANDKLITVIDVMKRMDLVFYRQYPDLAQSIESRYQFYQQHWKTALDDLIDSELIIADAAEKKLTVSEGDVREEMEAMFGPNVVLTIDNYGLTFEEVREITLAEITVRRMTFAMVNNKVLHKINPKEIRQIYETEVKTKPLDGSWQYRVISINGVDEEACHQISLHALDLLTSLRIPLESLETALKDEHLLDVTKSLSLSEEYVRQDKELSENHKAILANLQPGNYSEPVPQKNRITNQTVWRIFYLKDHTPGRIIPFHEVEDKIRQFLLEKSLSEEADRYRKQLRERYRINEAYLTEMVPEDFQPFTLT